MSIRRLPREMGIWILCDGTDETDCPEKRFTANVYAKVNRAAAAMEGWGRGLRKNHKRNDHCPKHMEIGRNLVKEAKAKREAGKGRRDELKKAKASGAPLPNKPKKPRKLKGGPATGVVSPGELERLKQAPSPSADSAPAPSTQ